MENAILIQMANQIAAFWSPYPKGEALESISKHIHSSWEPRMRDQMKKIIDSGG
jgi:formate dehydrogenase subunit delta